MAIFLEITQLGVAGLAVVLFYKLLVNHLHHVEIALEKLTDMIERFTDEANYKK